MSFLFFQRYFSKINLFSKPVQTPLHRWKTVKTKQSVWTFVNQANLDHNLDTNNSSKINLHKNLN